jgi:hypothetical protein
MLSYPCMSHTTYRMLSPYSEERIQKRKDWRHLQVTIWVVALSIVTGLYFAQRIITTPLASDPYHGAPVCRPVAVK